MQWLVVDEIFLRPSSTSIKAIVIVVVWDLCLLFSSSRDMEL